MHILSFLLSCDFLKNNSFALTSVPKKIIPSAVVIHYCIWYYFCRNRRYMNPNIQKNDGPNNFVGTFCVEFKIKFTDYIAFVFKFSTFWKA